MATFHDVDPAHPFRQQLQADVSGPVVITNTYSVPEGHMDETIAIWAKALEIGVTQPGYISAQLHRGIAGANVLINYSEWSSVRQLKDFLDLPEIKALVASFPKGTECRAHVFQKLDIDVDARDLGEYRI
ncbi:hypothetical protein QFC19_003357 [Naganishia cerealis]|uniref:Uncharacterized protein n=1 Tax=Naganishia cerealis TaxID=610337 RepID=A0ACC2W4L2_9TREE|nr:hypothetical protein QFC19_003357 [Naganishia cerealis]